MVDAWATTQQVTDAMGVSVTDAQLAQAQATVEVFCNRLYADTERIRPRDVYWLGRAVAFQAAWLKGQYDITTRLDSSQVQQDGVVASLGEHAMVLAPMAARALRRISWMRSRTLHVRSPFEDGSSWGADPLSDASDDSQFWHPMDGGR
ncbi:hypothetical protein [Streptomyces sp. ME19-01-6]|uniref:hypothetical protein n=1 Tax=Streptomyces sp. ME19-01-6 TaxID=3028686 RepID=UPI0029B054C7|nr:hypothetical protein [Streptomyces sp. ME19-01-6]MDX3230626.1 hypothetical protein [Streptomyces sp. ME19-01-6]